MQKPIETPKPRKRRPGAGRKPLGRKKAMFTLKPETIELVKRRAAQARMTRSEYVEQAILDFERRIKSPVTAQGCSKS